MKKAHKTRWWFGLELLTAYAAGVLLTLVLVAAVTIDSNHFSWEVLGLTAAFFPIGLFYFFLPEQNDSPSWFALGYIIYLATLAIGIAVNKRVILWILMALLLLNLSGCFGMLMEIESNGWQE